MTIFIIHKRKWKLRKISNFPKVTQLINDRVETDFLKLLHGYEKLFILFIENKLLH